MPEPLKAGVIGVGQMGKHHARVYSELCGAHLVGVADVNIDRANDIAGEYATDVQSTERLIEIADAVSVAVPTTGHYDLVRRCIEFGTNVLVEKPFVEYISQGEDLLTRANRADVTIQVGHIERFNPVTETLHDIVPGLNIVSVTAERLGPNPNRTIQESVITDLMIHDIDVVTSLIESDIVDISACGNANGRHAMATVEFENDIVVSLAASRVTQKKVRRLRITAESCYVDVDYIDQSVQIHRQSSPEYITDDGDLRYRHESIIENPVVKNSEPLKNEIRSFLEAIRTGQQPRVTAEDGLQSLMLTKKINEEAFGRPDIQGEVLME